ncbi:Mfa1 family fimbria major subunit [Parabacteroides sp. PF5-6]|uniref:Mfa1 family fimbria major subunit n=1 Tax=Parabacteroides sp. PF5-6 TaxID=1742403 RepID=UPI0024068379|nr:Mfa1 family fimbria major subunit [Parabacteroides sp. PF5-6]MDF9830793.1 hypothetical protein [Parabacteroides sp. PF5-6]
MKMKWKNALLALFIGGVTLTACSDKGDVIDPDITPVEQEGDAFFSFDMGMANKLLKTKATLAGDKAEQAVRDGVMALYDPTTKVCKYVFDLEATTDGSADFSGASVISSTADVSSFRTVAQRVDKQAYQLLVVLNPTTNMKDAIAKNKYYAEFEDVKEEAAENMKDGVDLTDNTIYKHIPMTNASGLVDVAEDQLHPTKDAAEAAGNAPKVQVDRILTKVYFKLDDAMTVAYGGSFVNATWQLDITNKKTYWVRRLTYVAPATNRNGDGITSNAGTTTWELEKDYSSIFREYVYAEDPNWDNVSLDRKETTGDLSGEFKYLAPGTTSTGFLHDLTTDQGFGTREYALENTMAPEEQWEDVTTRALVRANFVPSNKDIEAGDSYYFYGGAAFTYGQLEAMYNGTMLWPTAPSGLKEVVTKAVGEGFFGGTANAMTARSTSGETSDGQLGYYQNGISYYAVKIRHFDDALSSNEPEVNTNPDFMNFGRWGVVRNNMYQLTLKNVNGPGKPTIPDPEGPDDKKQYWLSVDIQVLPWVVRTQDIDL